MAGSSCGADDQYRAARLICLRLLERRARSRVELAEALHKRGVSADSADAVLTRLTEAGLINDSALADALVESRRRTRGLTRRALAEDLRARGISADVAQEALASITPESEQDVARMWVQRRLRTVAHKEPSVQLRRLVAMLARKGYSAELAYRVVREELANQLSADDDP